MDNKVLTSQDLAAEITRSASKQTYFTIKFFADRERTSDAYRAYAYFRWVDDIIDADSGMRAEKIAFANRQQSLLQACYQGKAPVDMCLQESMLADLVGNDLEKNSGLQTYLRNMMDVMLFDAKRQGRVISKVELSEYSRKLATAVTEAMYYFIGHKDASPNHPARYLSVTAAHIIHMLRDSMEDLENGYFNIPQEYLQAHGISPEEINSQGYREWVESRIKLARLYFKAGRECTAQVRNWRCRLAGFAYTARNITPGARRLSET